MTRHTKLKTRKAEPHAPAEDLAAFARAEAMVLTMLSAVERALTSGEDITPALVREAAGLARAVTTMEAERRNRENMERRLAREFGLADVIEFLRQLDATERARTIRTLQHMATDAGKSGLA